MFTETQILRQSAGVIATALGGTWATRPKLSSHDSHVILAQDNDEIRLSLRLVGANGKTYGKGAGLGTERLSITGSVVHHADESHQVPYGMRAPVITVARDRGAEAIARDIERRVLQRSREQLIKLLSSVASSRDAEAARGALADKLGGEVIGHRTTSSQTTVSVPGGEMRISHGADAVRAEIDLTPEQAVAIFTILSQP